MAHTRCSFLRDMHIGMHRRGDAINPGLDMRVGLLNRQNFEQVKVCFKAHTK